MTAPEPPPTVVELTVSVWPWSIGVVPVGAPGAVSGVFTVTAAEGDEVVVSGVDDESVAATSK